MLRFRKALIGLAGVGLAAHQYDTHFCYERFNRNIRTVYVAAQTVYDYKVYLDSHPESLSEVHQRVAQRWYDLCAQNGGLYIKLGQGISMMNHVLPPEYVRIFNSLQDRAPTVSEDVVRKIIKDQYGMDASEVFASFNPEPLASASIAQVHSATLRDGRHVAVKVQKPNIEYQMPWDLFCYRSLVWCFEKLFDLPMYWTVDSVCQQISLEADFYKEAEHTQRARRDLVGNVPNVYVPAIETELSRKKILVMEWIDGVKISNKQAIEKMGFTLKDVTTTMMNAFSYQIFVSGFVHGDPHPGNVFVRPNPSNPKQHQVVVLDHGLYVEEPEEFRLQYCRLWKAMVLMRLDELASICKEWGIKDSELFASIQLLKPFSKSNTVVHVRKTTKQDMVRMQVEGKERVRHLLEDTNLVPRALIILGRTLNILRANNKANASVVNRVSIMAGYAAVGLRHRNTAGNNSSLDTQASMRASTWRERVLSGWDYFVFRAQMFMLAGVYYYTQLRQQIQRLVGSKPEGFEDLLEKSLAQTVEAKLGFKIHSESMG